MSEIRVNAVKNTSGVERYLAQAWVNFNGTGTVAIRAAGNVSSITDNGVGDYTVNFSAALADANYAVAASAQPASGTAFALTGYGTNGAGVQTTPTSGSVRLCTSYSTTSGTNHDATSVSVAIFR